MLGVTAGSIGTVPPSFALVASVIAGVLAAGASLPPRARLLAVGVVAALLGLVRAQTALVADRAQRAAWEHLYNRPLVLRGVIASVEDRGALARLTVGSLTADTHPLPGFLRALVPVGRGFPEKSVVMLRGTVISPGELRRTGTQPSESLDRIFARHQIFAAMRRPTVRVEVEGAPRLVTRLRANLRQIFHKSLPEPAAGLLSAFILGFEADLAADLRDAAAATGLLHLVAISGTHLGVMAAAIWWLAMFLGFTRRPAVVLTGLMLILFLTLVGFPESGVRSGIMVLLVLWASLVGRVAAGLRMLLVTVVVMTAAAPRLLLGDVGFQLSALAVWGLLVLAPVLRSALPAEVGRVRWVTNAVVYTLAAELATLPVALATFGRISLVAPITNVLAVGLFPFILAVGVIVLFLGVLSHSLALLVAPITAVPATLFLGIARIGSAVPFHAVKVEPISPPVFLGSVLALLIIGQWAYLRRQRRPVVSAT